MAVRLGDRESELVFGVEAYADNEFALGSPMLGEYHRTLAEVIGMNRGLAVVDALVQRLRSGLEAARLEVQDHLANVAGVLGSIALLLTLVFGIYGVSTQEIDPSNFLQAGYWWIYLVAVFSLYALVGLLTRRWLPAVPRRPRAADG
jgi:Mg2+ and Co2+ transporter CorA